MTDTVKLETTTTQRRNTSMEDIERITERLWLISFYLDNLRRDVDEIEIGYPPIITTWPHSLGD